MGTRGAEVPALGTWLGAAQHPGVTLAKGPPGTSAPVLSFLGSLPSSRCRSLRPLMQLWKSQPPSQPRSAWRLDEVSLAFVSSGHERTA